MSYAGGPGRMTLPEAGVLLHLSVQTIEGLVEAGYLSTTESSDGEPLLALGDIKAFLARNTDGDPNLDVGDSSLDDLDPQVLLDALAQRSDDMARRALDLLIAAFPEAGRWSPEQQQQFSDEARTRFEAIVAVSAIGREVDRALIDDLAAVGAEAAAAKTPLLELLLVLRISRDLVVQTAVEVAEERGRHWGLALSLLLTRVLPAMDQMTDAVACGYWQSFLRS